MNERIKDIAYEAGFILWENEDYKPPNGVVDWACVYDDELEKFAELIVKECLNNMANCDGDLDFAIWKTKQDFGVKE